MRAPPPAAKLSPKVLTWKAGRQFARCHHSAYGATEFNREPGLSQRFRPFVARRRTVPTLYGSETLDGALSETLFHTVPLGGPDRRVRLSRFDPWLLSRLSPRRDLRLADLRDRALARLDITREELIESPASTYPETAGWASALYHCPLEPDGLVWNARQGDQDPALILFQRGRVKRQDLSIEQRPIPLAVGPGLELAYEVAERVGITLTS